MDWKFAIWEAKQNDGELLSNSFLNQVGLTEMEQEDLAEMNDDGVTFKRIANYIERNL